MRKKLLTLLLAVAMVFVMGVPAFATDNIVVEPVTYPVNADVMILSEGGPVTDIGGNVISTNYAEAYESVSFASPFTPYFTQYLPQMPAAGAHQLASVPTVMDAICKAYVQNNGSFNGANLGWDSNPYEGPQGAFLTKLYNNETITTVSGLYTWEGYSWNIYLNNTVGTWNPDTRTGKIPMYASNIQLKEGDTVFVLYEHTVEHF